MNGPEFIGYAGDPEIRVFADDPLSQDALAAALTTDLGVPVDAPKPMGLPGFEWIVPSAEVFGVYVGAKVARRIDVSTNQLVDRIIEAAVSWARSALRRERSGWRRFLPLRRRSGRPKRIVIYGPDLEVLRTVLVRRPDADPEISDSDDSTPPR
jgi:hypothetical protein